MFKIAVLIWMMVGTTLAGLCVLAVLLIPALSHGEMLFVPVAALAGFGIGVPLSYMIASRISRPAH